MKFAYADPPYFECCALYEHFHDSYGCWDEIATHAALIDDLNRNFEVWAMSGHTPSLRHILPLCPDGVRVGAWVKPFASFKPHVNPAYAWEPVIFSGARARRDRAELTVRDWVSAPITLQRGLTGVKPDAFSFWMFDFLGARPDDEFVDLFPGSGAVTRAWDKWKRQTRLIA